MKYFLVLTMAAAMFASGLALAFYAVKMSLKATSSYKKEKAVGEKMAKARQAKKEKAEKAKEVENE